MKLDKSIMGSFKCGLLIGEVNIMFKLNAG